MERVARLIARMKIPGGPTAEDLLRAAWPLAAGKVIARHTRAARVEGLRLVVDVEDESWRRQLAALEGQILENLYRILGRRAVRGLEFRLRPPRRGPAQASANVAAGDEADRVADPVLQRLYRKPRARSSA